MKTFLKVVGILAAVVIVVIAVAAIFLSSGMSATKNLQIGTVDPSGLPDGAYEGSYSAGRFSNSVKVTVKDGRIESIETEKPVTFEKADVTKALFDSVIAEQNTDVDAMSGATLTSKAYLKSIEAALSKK